MATQKFPDFVIVNMNTELEGKVLKEEAANSESIGRRCCRYVQSELHYSSLCCCYTDNKAFSFSPWMPYKWRYQWLYVAYRWVVALYFLGWLVYLSVEAGQDHYIQAKFLIYLTNWGFLLFNAYLLIAALFVTASFCHQVTPPTSSVPPLTSKGCVSCTPLSCLTALHWALGVVGLEFAVAITILFWLFFNDPDRSSINLSIHSVHVHMLNGIVALLDTWVSGIPFRLLHFVYAVLFGCLYIGFTVVYYVAQGTNISNNPYIYPILDYGSNPGFAAGVAMGCGLVFTSLLHFTFYFMYLARYWLSRLLQTRVYGSSVWVQLLEK